MTLSPRTACKSGTEIPSHSSEKLNDPVCSLSIKGPVGDLHQLELPGSQFEGIEIKRKMYELTGIPISIQTLFLWEQMHPQYFSTNVQVGNYRSFSQSTKWWFY